MPESAPITRALEVARRDLLDLGLRNTLLNYRPLRTRGVEVVDEKPEEVFRILVSEGKSMTFTAGEAGPPPDAGELAQPGEEREAAARHKDARLQTAYPSAQLQSRLLATYHAARTSMEEQGVNTLYLALGMLLWHEEDAPDKLYRAPLLLIPVQLSRSDARDRFRLVYTEEELGANISLAEKLKQAFGIRSFPELPDADDLDVPSYFQKVVDAVRGRTGWSVDSNAIALGFFSFAKFLMYRDLDPATWPAPDAMLQHRTLQSLLGETGFPAESSNYRDDDLLDDQLKSRELLQVVDADSSQTLAILDALDGKTMVIQGPPGTGKSQTIVNLIAGAVAKDQRVLFVSEKMAALDVVKRRLDQAGLGAACLELHSNRTNKKTIVEELRRTAFSDRLRGPEPNAGLGLLADVRGRLNDYCRAVNDPIGASGESACECYGKLLQLRTALQDCELPSLELQDAGAWTAEETARRTLLVQLLQDHVARTGSPQRHPFWGSRLTKLLPGEREEIRKLATAAAAACEALERAGRKLEPASGEAVNCSSAVELLSRNEYVAGAPDLTGLSLTAPEWTGREPWIWQALAAGKKYRDVHRQFDAVLRAEAWTTDTTEIRRTIVDVGARWWRVFSPGWRKSQKALDDLCVSASPPVRTAQLALLDAIAESIRCAAIVERAQDVLPGLFGPSWNGMDSDWELLERQAHWAIGAHKGMQQGRLAAWCLDLAKIAADRSALGARVEECKRALTVWRAATSEWVQRLQLGSSPLIDEPLADLANRCHTQASRADDLPSLVSFNQIAAECEQEKLGSVASVAASWPEAGELLLPLFHHSRLEALLTRAFQERPALATFDGIRHSHTVAEFRRLDLLQLEHNRAVLAARHAQSMPATGGAGEIGVLWREFEKRSRFLPIRSLMLKAGHAIQSLKRVFMMSPLSIANYLPPGAIGFDLIIFDEASQVRPVDALGAIVRGQQVVVVGDSRQLPPTSFFDSLVGVEDEPDEDAATADLESVLGLFCSRGAHQRMLRWHYRSRHESLIAVSNHLFYQDRLVVFPSPDRDRSKLGLRYHRLEKAAYERSRTRTNPEEAKAVAAAVMEHARRQLELPPEQRETLGVAAFSVAQMDAVLNQLEILRREEPACEEFFQYPPHEPFFVKNLENVQGDERDVIFISIGYGRTAEGQLAMNFGPLNRNGGERRLNVLISRARRRCEIFTSLAADDLDLTKTTSSGVAALKTFLQYAEGGQLEQAAAAPAREGVFEEEVLARLRALGHEVEALGGAGSFVLDLAVTDPDRRDRHILGIECDGTRYRSAQSARDRDRLRESVLAGLGWRLHRIWSTDWYHNPAGELHKTVRAIEAAQAGGPPAAPPAADTVANQPQMLSAPQPRSMAAPPYECAQVRFRPGEAELHAIEPGRLAELLRQVVEVESPVHSTEAWRRILNALGIQRSGTKLQQKLQEAVLTGAERGLFTRRDDFLWTAAMESPAVRDRSHLPAASRKLELVSPEEVRNAILQVVKESCGIVPEETAGAVCRLFGFARVTEEMSAAVAPHRDALIRDGRLALEGVNLVLVVPDLPR